MGSTSKTSFFFGGEQAPNSEEVDCSKLTWQMENPLF